MATLPTFNPDGGQPPCIQSEQRGLHIQSVIPGGSSPVGWVVGSAGTANQPAVMILQPYAGAATAFGPVGSAGTANQPSWPLA